MDRLSEIEERAATMTRDGLLTLLRAWGWSLRGQANGSALDIWEKGRATVHLPNLADAADYDECLQQAEWTLATAEGPRLLAVVREVEALHTPEDHASFTVHTATAAGHSSHDVVCCRACHTEWPCPTAAAVQKLGEGS